MDFIRDLATQLYDRIIQLLHNSSQGTLQLSGILGLVIALIGYYHLRGGNAEPPPTRRQQHQRQRDPGTSDPPSTSQQAQAGSPRPKASQPGPQQPPLAGRDSAAARAVHARLQGVRRVTLSCPGVLLQPGQLSESAMLQPEAAELLREMCHMGLEVFLISMVRAAPMHAPHASLQGTHGPLQSHKHMIIVNLSIPVWYLL